MAIADRLLTVEEAASTLSVKRSTLYQWAREGRLPSVKLLGRALRFRESDLQKLIKQSVKPALRPLDEIVERKIA